MAAGKKTGVDINSHRHSEAKRKNIPTAELEAFLAEEEAAPKPKQYRAPRQPEAEVVARDPDRDPQLVWRGKEAQDAEGLTVDTVPVYIQEKVHPQAIIADLKRRSDTAAKERAAAESAFIPDLFGDFNGLPDRESELEFYQHDKHWTNRMILGDSLLVMNSLAEKEALKGQVQCIYFDPPYGIKFNSNWQPSTKSRDVTDGKLDSMTREPEMVRAFRDTWKDGVNSYLSYLRDRLTVMRDLLTESGSIFVQIGDENVHNIRSILDEIFGSDNLISQITIEKTSGQTQVFLAPVTDFVLWYAKDRNLAKYRSLWTDKKDSSAAFAEYNRIQLPDFTRRRASRLEIEDPSTAADGAKLYRQGDITSQGGGREKGEGAASWFPVEFRGRTYRPTLQRRWSTNEAGMERLIKASRVEERGINISYARFLDDFVLMPMNNIWDDVKFSSRSEDKVYVVQTSARVIERCILMTTDPGDLVLDPTCGSGTTAYVAEQWGRRWITVDTSRVALALARQRLMAARFPGYLLQDSTEGARKEGELTGKPPRLGPFARTLRQGFVYEQVPKISLKSIANNAEIDVIWDKWQEVTGPLLDNLNDALEQAWEEWEVPRDPAPDWPAAATALHAEWWQARRDRQAEIDASISRNADIEFLYDRPYEDKGKVRVTGPFTVESLSPHRVLSAGADDEELLRALEAQAEAEGREMPARTTSLRRDEAVRGEEDFVRVVLDNLKKSGVQNTKKGETLTFSELKPWAGGRFVHAEGRYEEASAGGASGNARQEAGSAGGATGNAQRRIAICIGPEYGTVSRALVSGAAREAVELFDVLVVCGFAFEPTVNEELFRKFGRLTVLKARMNQDLHMADALKAGAGNLFVVFGEPDIGTIRNPDGTMQVEIRGVDIFDPTTGEVRASSVDDIACWFLDTDYDDESFFVRHAYFLGGNDPYKKLKTTLKSEIDEDAWSTLYSNISRPFEVPSTGRIAVKVINHYGDEVLKVYEVG